MCILCFVVILEVLSILQYHKPQELIFPLAYFIYDPVILRLFLTYFNVDINPAKFANMHTNMMSQDYYDQIAFAQQQEQMQQMQQQFEFQSGRKRRSTVDGNNNHNNQKNK